MPLESGSYEDSIRKAISLCGISQANYEEIPRYIVDRVRLLLDLGHKRIIDKFNMEFKVAFEVK